MTIQILVVDDHEVVRLGLKSLVVGTEIEIIAEAGTKEEAEQLVFLHRPDVVLLDICVSGRDGFSVLSKIKMDFPKIPILMFSIYDNPTYIARAVALGASGYLLKKISREVLFEAIRTAASGETTWTRQELRHVTGSLATPRLSMDLEVSLTQRESEVLRQLAGGRTNKQIAETFHISYETVKEHVQHILRKVGVADRTQAAVWAVRKGLV